MVFIILLMIVGGISGFKTFVEEEGIEGFFSFLAFLFYGFVGAVLGFLLGLLIAWALPAKLETKVYTQNLECLQDNNSVNGGFFLGTGSVEGKMKYVYYYKDADSLYHMKQIDYANASIKYSDETPKIETYKEEATKDFINYFAWDYTEDKYIIYIPKGSIKQNFNLDAQ